MLSLYYYNPVYPVPDHRQKKPENPVTAAIDLDNTTFRCVSRTADGKEVLDPGIKYQFQCNGSLVAAIYSGGGLEDGCILGQYYPEDGSFSGKWDHRAPGHDLRLMGDCETTPEVLPDGRVRLTRKWTYPKTEGGGDNEGIDILESVGKVNMRQ